LNTRRSQNNQIDAGIVGKLHQLSDPIAVTNLRRETDLVMLQGVADFFE